MPNQAIEVVRSPSPIAKTLSASTPKTLAISTFFANPIPKRKRPNNLLIKKTNIPITNVKKDNKNYAQISNYKPTGNLIYNEALLKRIETTSK